MELAADLEFHPGYSLRIRTLGQFTVSRGQQLVDENDWRREKARQLLQLLLVNRGQFMQREEIATHLWPDADETAAEQQFKVTLNTLHGVLEPGRPPRSPTLFVQRRGSAYGLNPSAPILIDAALFEQLISLGEKNEDPMTALNDYRQALSLYRGDFIPDCFLYDQCREEQARLKRLYLNTATRVTESLLALGKPQATVEVIELCEQVLQVDNCWEASYQHLIRAHLQRKDRVQALRTYDRCVACLRKELDVEPMPETEALYLSIRG
jgi:DNA-binding SARP family transcriptional activator